MTVQHIVSYKHFHRGGDDDFMLNKYILDNGKTKAHLTFQIFKNKYRIFFSIHVYNGDGGVASCQPVLGNHLLNGAYVSEIVQRVMPDAQPMKKEIVWWLFEHDYEFDNDLWLRVCGV